MSKSDTPIHSDVPYEVWQEPDLDLILAPIYVVDSKTMRVDRGGHLHSAVLT